MTRSPRWVPPSLAARISAHVHAWEKAKQAPAERETPAFVTISREFGCDGAALGYRLAEILNERSKPTIPWVAYDRELLDKVAGELKLRREILESLDDHRRDEMIEFFDTIINKRVEDAVVFRKMAEIIRSLAIRTHAVLVGRGSYLITLDLKAGLHLRLVAPLGWRVEHYAEKHHVSYRDAERSVREGERQREKFIQTFFARDPSKTVPHHLIIDNSRFGLDSMAEITLAALRVC